MIGESAWWPYAVMAFLVGMPALVGAALIGAAVRRWSRMRALAAGGRQATARVVDNQLESRSGGQTSFRPVVTFRTETGQDVTTVLPDLAGFRSHLVGAEIPVFYDPGKPSDATPAQQSRAQLVTTVVFGALFLAFALLAYRMADFVIDEFTQPW